MSTDEQAAPVGTTEQAAPEWKETFVKASGSTGYSEIRALVHPWCPGLAVTMFAFGCSM